MNAGPEDGGAAVSTELDRHLRLVPSAVTPVRLPDILAAWRHREGGCDRFERAVASFLDAETAATYTTYRSALVDCLRTLKREADGRRDVLLPAYSAPDFDVAIEAAGLTARYCDVDPETLAIDVPSVDRRIGDDTLAMFAVNLLGFGSRMDEVVDRCAAHGVSLIEVLGYSLGTACRGRRLGTFGDAAVVNFQEGKPIPVGGGAVAWNRRGVDRVRENRDSGSPNYAAMAGYSAFARPRLYFIYHGLATALGRLGVDTGRFTTHSAPKGSVDYDPPHESLSDFQGALAHRILGGLQDHRRRRARTARFYADALAGCAHITLVRPASSVHDVHYVRYPILVDDPDRRDDLRRALFDAGIQTSALYGSREIDGDRFPGAERLQRSVLTLPTHPYVSAADRETVVDVVEDVVG